MVTTTTSSSSSYSSSLLQTKSSTSYRVAELVAATTTITTKRCPSSSSSFASTLFSTTTTTTESSSSSGTTTTPETTDKNSKVWKVYLSGEIHSDWRDVIATGVSDMKLPVILTSPNCSHEDSDDCGAIILGMEEERRNWDSIGAKMNGIRTQTLIKDADIVIIRFGEKYRQWNAAYDAGYATALGKPLIILHPPSIGHMLKEVNSTANVICQEPKQVIQTLAYVIHGILPTIPKDGEQFIPIADRLGKGNPNP